MQMKGIPRGVFAGAVGAVLLLVSGGLFFFVPERFGFSHSKQIKFQQELAALHQQHCQELRTLHEDFLENIKLIPSRHFTSAENNVDSVASHFSSFKTVFHLVGLMACDKVSSTRRTQEFVAEHLKKHLVESCVAGGYAYQECLQNFLHRLQEKELLFKVRLVQKMKQIPPSPHSVSTLKAFAADLQKTDAQISDLAVSKSIASAGAVVEALFIKNVLRALSRICGKLAVKAAVCSTLPAADGPLPAGDILALGGFAWCAYDIYNVQAVLPEELRSTLRRAVADYHSNIRRKTLKHAQDALELCKTSADQTLIQLRSR